MLQFIQNLRIGTKLAITSALSILLVGLLIYAQMSGSSQIREINQSAMQQQTLAKDATEAKAAVRGLQIGLRDVLLAATPTDVQKASDYFAARRADADGTVGEMLKLSRSPENRERIARLKTLLADYAKGRDQIAAARSEIIRLGARRMGSGGPATDATTGVADLTNEIVRLRTEVTLPVNSELMAIADKIVEFANQRSKEIDAVAVAKAASVDQFSLIIGLAVAILLIGSCVFSILTIARPTRALSTSMEELAEGNFEVVLPGLGRKDEIGAVAAAVEKFKIKAQEKARLEAEAQRQQEMVAAEQRKRDMHKLADAFENAVGEIIETVSSASTELEASASTLTTTAERSQELTVVVAAASEEASTNVQSVASATEEMASSVNEISRQVQESARIANEAVDQARMTNDRVGELSRAASRIGDVVELINTIAGQTNLLALNATIEAARAGESGRGFAVVASEVKALAEQTAKATGDISEQIVGIQTATNESVGAIEKIGVIIGRMSEISSTIASAIEEQGAATREISRNIQQAAQGTIQVSSNITDVQRGTSETGSASSQVLSAAQLLSQDSTRLKTEVGKFLNSVRAA